MFSVVESNDAGLKSVRTDEVELKLDLRHHGLE
jgi:hypothetical protein